MKNNTLTALSGVRVGHATQLVKLTGCTVVLFDKPYPVAYKAYGGGAATYNTDMLQNGKAFYHRHALFIAGGSMTGLQCGGEIQKYLIENKIGFRDYKAINPSISGAIVYDLGMRLGQLDPVIGRIACKNATTKAVENGSVGAGTGSSVGKFEYLDGGTVFPGMKAGVGSARIDLPGGIRICALSVVNAVGNIILPNGTILAGNRSNKKSERFKTFEGFSKNRTTPENTTISIVGINVDLKTRENYERVAHFGSLGQVHAIDPVHTSVDGDTVFVFSTEEIKKPLNKQGNSLQTHDSWLGLDVDVLGHAAGRAVQESIYDACYKAQSIRFDTALDGVVPSVADRNT